MRWALELNPFGLGAVQLVVEHVEYVEVGFEGCSFDK
jgi:hypothetical protein